MAADLAPPSYLRIEGLNKDFPGHRAVIDLSLDVAQGEILALLGPSGSGKTTTLRLLAGFETPSSGRVVVDGEDVTRLSPERRRFGMVFQNYALFPHLSVGENVAFGLHGPKDRIGHRVREVLRMVDLEGFERRHVAELSGGQQQRVAVARSLAPEPRVLLLDEPLSNLDPALRGRTRHEIRTMIKRVGITTVFVTHEQDEAFDLGDRIAVMNGGHLDQVGTADELYDQPASAFVATFVGRANRLPGELAGGRPGSTAIVRPEAMSLGEGPLEGTVTFRRFAGAFAYFTVEVRGQTRFEVFAPHHAARPGDVVRVAVERVLFWEEGR